jgi:hypothetical protein
MLQKSQKSNKVAKSRSTTHPTRKIATKSTTRLHKKVPTVTIAKRQARLHPDNSYQPYEERFHTPTAPDLLRRNNVWERKALEDDIYPRRDQDGDLETSDREFVPMLNDEDFTALMEDTYEKNPLDLRFDNFRKVTEMCGIPRADLGNTNLHMGLQHLIRTLTPECTLDFHYNLALEAAHRCMDPVLYKQTLDTFRSKGFKPETRHITPLLHMATFRRKPNVFEETMAILGQDMSKWTTEVAEHVVMFHEMHQEWDQADKVYAQGVSAKLLPIPWKHQRQSHINAPKFAQVVPSRHPKWDEKSPEADIVHLEGSPTLLSRVKLRYACYSLRDQCENNDKVHPKINIPHNLVIQTVVRGKNAKDGLEIYHKLWQPVQQDMQSYLVKFGVQTCRIARAANLFWVDHTYFDRLPTPGNQNPQTKPEYRPFFTEGRRKLIQKYAAEEEQRLLERQQRVVEFAQPQQSPTM